MPVGGGIETPSTLWKDQSRYIPVTAAQDLPQVGGFNSHFFVCDQDTFLGPRGMWCSRHETRFYPPVR